MTKETVATFSGTFKVVDSLDFGDKQIPPQYEARIGESETEKYVVAEENGEVIGFVVLDLPDDKNGRVSLALDTHLNTQEQELLPDSPEGLMSFLREKGILPADIDNAGLASEVGPDYFAVFKNGRKISFDEYMSLLVSKK